MRKRSDNINLSSVGVKFKAKKLSLNLSLGLDDIGLSGAIHNGSTDNTLALKTNLSNLRLALKCQKQYTGMILIKFDSNKCKCQQAVAASIVVFVLTGQPVWQSAYS